MTYNNKHKTSVFFAALSGLVLLAFSASQASAQESADDEVLRQAIYDFGVLSATHHAAVTSKVYRPNLSVGKIPKVKEMKISELLAYNPQYLAPYEAGALITFAKISRALQQHDIASCFMDAVQNSGGVARELVASGYIPEDESVMKALRESCAPGRLIGTRLR